MSSYDNVWVNKENFFLTKATAAEMVETLLEFTTKFIMPITEEFKLTPSSYRTFVSPTGLEFIKNAEGQFVLGSSITAQQQQQKAPIGKVGGIIGNIEPVKANADWNVYSERLEQYFSANCVEEQRAIGPEVYKTLRDLCSPIITSK